MRLGIVFALLAVFASAAVAESTGDAVPAPIHATADKLFKDVPPLRRVPRMLGVCGADESVNPFVAYCATQNVILLRDNFMVTPSGAYEQAHVMGHAIQIRHGVADVALREIRARPEEEEKLRGWVTRQVECIAGVIMAKAGFTSFQMEDHYHHEPMTGSHWGRDPLSVGPKVSIGTAARQEWLDIGLKGDLSACAVGEFGSELLTNALR